MSQVYLKNGNIVVEDAQIFYLNFAGNQSRYNNAGMRNFCVFIDDPDLAKMLIEDGWNVRIKTPRNEDEQSRYFLQVSVNFNYRIPPRITMVTSRNQTLLNEETVGDLDMAEIRSVDLTIRPRRWLDDEGTPQERERIKAYLHSMWVTIEEDPFADKYARND